MSPYIIVALIIGAMALLSAAMLTEVLNLKMMANAKQGCGFLSNGYIHSKGKCFKGEIPPFPDNLPK